MARRLLYGRIGEQNSYVPFLEYRPAECSPHGPNSSGAERVASPRSEGRSQLSRQKNNDDHAWSGQEDKAYRIYAKQNHRKASEFSKLKDDDQQNYWNWRHEHSDSLLKIEIK